MKWAEGHRHVRREAGKEAEVARGNARWAVVGKRKERALPKESGSGTSEHEAMYSCTHEGYVEASVGPPSAPAARMVPLVW